jgi:hypothetical protein
VERRESVFILLRRGFGGRVGEEGSLKQDLAFIRAWVSDGEGAEMPNAEWRLANDKKE